MSIQRKRTLKRLSYICLSLSSIVLSSEAQGENSSLQGSSDQEKYRELHNRIAVKYKHRRLPDRDSRETQGLREHTEQFHLLARNLREGYEERDEQLNNLGHHVAEEGGTLAEALIERNVNDERTRSTLLRLKDRAIRFLSSFFS